MNDAHISRDAMPQQMARGVAAVRTNEEKAYLDGPKPCGDSVHVSWYTVFRCGLYNWYLGSIPKGADGLLVMFYLFLTVQWSL